MAKRVAARALDPSDPINELVFFGKKFQPNVIGDLTEASLDASLDQITQVTLKMIDPGFARLRSGIYAPRIPVVFDGYSLEVSNVNTDEVSGNEGIGVSIRPRIVRKLKARTGKKVMKDVSPSQFVEQECKAIDCKAVTQKSAKRRQVARDVRGAGEGGKGEGRIDTQPSSWTTFQRLAQEVGFIVFESNNVIYFGKPTWLLEQALKKAATTLHAHWGGPREGAYRPHAVPNCTKSLESKEVEVTVAVPVSAWKKCKVGNALKLTGIPEFNGEYLINSVNYDLIGATTITVTASTPVNPEKIEPNSQVRSLATGSGGGSGLLTDEVTGVPTGTKSVSAFVNNCLSQAGDTYIFGAEASLSNPNPGAFDCSELIQWAAARAGVYMPDGSAAQIGYCQAKGQGMSVSAGINTYGALLYTPGHIAVSLGNGETVEAAGGGYGIGKGSVSRSFRWTAAGRIPGMRY